MCMYIYIHAHAHIYVCTYLESQQSFMNSCSLNNNSLCKHPSLKGLAFWGTAVCKGLFGYPAKKTYICIIDRPVGLRIQAQPGKDAGSRI